MKYPILSLLLLLISVTATSAKPITMSLQIREGELRRSPSFLSPVTAKVAYGDRLTVEETRGAWRRVTAQESNRTGWLHMSALTKKKVTLTAGESDAEVAASSGELALAGKGFNSDVEAEFKKENTKADFTAVEAIESIRISIRTIQQFLKSGDVTPEGGVQ